MFLLFLTIKWRVAKEINLICGAVCINKSGNSVYPFWLFELFKRLFVCILFISSDVMFCKHWNWIVAQFQDSNIKKTAVFLQLYCRLLDVVFCILKWKQRLDVKVVQEGKEKNLDVPCLVLCACSDCAPVLLIFNGKWLRFSTKPLELGNKNPSSWSASLTPKQSDVVIKR